jgi:hypothetical protein
MFNLTTCLGIDIPVQSVQRFSDDVNVNTADAKCIAAMCIILCGISQLERIIQWILYNCIQVTSVNENITGKCVCCNLWTPIVMLVYFRTQPTQLSVFVTVCVDYTQCFYLNAIWHCTFVQKTNAFDLLSDQLLKRNY